MTVTEIFAQSFGIIGLAAMAYSFQEKNNKRFLTLQAFSGFMFFLNFLLINAIAASLYNLINVVRGILLMKNNKEHWKLIAIEVLYTLCFVFSLSTILGNYMQIFLSGITYLSLVVMTFLMWKGNGKHIRYGQFMVSSPAWIVHNIFNFSLGGLICEILCMTSVVISFIRYGKNGFEK